MKHIVLLLSISVLATLILGWVNLAEAEEATEIPRVGYLGWRGSRHSRTRRKNRRQLMSLHTQRRSAVLLDSRPDTEDTSCCDLHQPKMIADCYNLSRDSI